MIMVKMHGALSLPRYSISYIPLFFSLLVRDQQMETQYLFKSSRDNLNQIKFGQQTPSHRNNVRFLIEYTSFLRSKQDRSSYMNRFVCKSVIRIFFYLITDQNEIFSASGSKRKKNKTRDFIFLMAGSRQCLLRSEFLRGGRLRSKGVENMVICMPLSTS